MKKITKFKLKLRPTSISLTNSFGIFLKIALIIPAIALSQTSPSPVDLGTSGNFVILAESGISTTGTTSILGDIGVSPIAASAITGFGLIMDSSGEFSTTPVVTGKVFAANYAPPTPTMLLTAVSDMETAYTDAAGRPADYNELHGGDLTGKTLTRGVYKWGTGVLISSGGVTISGNPTDVFIFEIAQDLIIANGANINLIGGVKPSNIFWQVAGQVTLGTNSNFSGIILCQTAIVMQTGAAFNGKALAQTAVTLDSNNIVVADEISESPCNEYSEWINATYSDLKVTTSKFQNRNRVIDNNLNNTSSYTAILGGSAWIDVKDNTATGANVYPAGSYAGFMLNDVDLVSIGGSLKVQTYLGNILQDTYTDANLLSTFLGSGKRRLGFKTTKSFDRVRLVVNAGLTVISTVHVYYVEIVKPCTPLELECNEPAPLVQANGPGTSGHAAIIEPSRTGLEGLINLGTLVNTENVIMPDTDSYARMAINVGALATASISVRDLDEIFPIGHFAGFNISNGTLLDIELLESSMVRTYLDGVLQETAIGGSLLTIELLAGTGRYNIGFITTKPFDEIRYTLSNILTVNLGETRIYHAIATRICSESCIQIVEGGEWNKHLTPAEVAQLPAPLVTYDPITVVGGNAGMFFDVYRLDNSFNLKINGQSIVLDAAVSNELQFDLGTQNARMNNVRFLNGGLYGVDADPIWKIIGTPDNPAIRIEISAEGKVSLYGSKRSEGPLFQLVLFNGAELNDVVWYTDAENTIELTQDAYGSTRLNGHVFGLDICSNGFYDVTKVAEFDSFNPAATGDEIKYTIDVKNIFNEDIHDVVVVDPLLGGEILVSPLGDINNDGILNANETWSYIAYYAITAEDIARQGVYNLATVFGKDGNGNPIPTEKSYDPNGLDPNDPNYNSECPTCTFTPITPDCDIMYPIVSDDPFYWAYNYSTYKGGQAPVTNSGTVVTSNGGFVFDIYRLDNSFNMIINDVKLFDDEIQLDAKLTPGVNMEFVDGGEYGKDGIPRILALRGDQETPMMKVKVAADGTVQLFGSQMSHGELFELKPKEGRSFNVITWNTDPNLLNTIKVSQEVWWKTVFEGYGYGMHNDCESGKSGGDQPLAGSDGNIYTAKYYPNPVNTTLYVQANTVIEEIAIYNVLGQRVINLKPNSDKTEINVEQLQADVYIMKLTLNGKVETYRVIKE